MIFIKIIILQVFWYLTVSAQDIEAVNFIFFAAIALSLINYKIFDIKVSLSRYVILLFIFSLWGIIQDGILIKLGFMESKYSILWLNSLWVIFLCYFGDIFNKFQKLSIWQQGLIGSLGGMVSYYSGCKIAGITISNSYLPGFLFIIGLSWAIFFPLSLCLFYKDDFWNYVLDKSVYFSFDRTGFDRHKKYFRNNKWETDLNGKTILVTGGTGGIGLSVCRELTKRGAYVYFTGRNELRGRKYETSNSKFVRLDMADWDSFIASSGIFESLDGVILNAGGMPENLELNSKAVEHQAASQLFGHYNLIDILERQGQLNDDCRISWVSSGGMYLKKLDLSDLIKPKEYDKVEVYANVKRAQITLVEELVKQPRWNKYYMFSMHPGWVDTVGIKEALPKFYNFTKNRLRSIEQGSDTISWLHFTRQYLYSGAFYFDRRTVSPYISSKFVPSEKERLELLSLVNNYTVK